jgi:CubicO group peptidase (beta-lactamase class C family)
LTLSKREVDERIGALSEDAEASDLVLVADMTSETYPRPGWISRVLSRLSGPTNRTVYLSMGSPFSATALPASVDAALLSFGSARPSVEAIAEAVFGLSRVCGKLPVHLSSEFPRGAGLCIAQSLPRPALPEEAGMDAHALSEIGDIIMDAIADSAFPGAAVAVGRGDLLPLVRSYGSFTYDSDQHVEPSSQFDLASLTKVIATTTAVMLLYEADSLSLDDTVADYVPEFGQNGKQAVTIRDLLTHTGGLIPFRAFYTRNGATRDTVLQAIYADSLFYEPGTMSRYSDFGPIVLAEAISRITGQPFAEFARQRIFEPLGMKNTGFKSAGKVSDPRVVPTEVDDYFRHRLIQGVVHDENAYLLGGTAGHAGLFSTVEDLARFAHMIIREGKVGDRVFLKPETLALFTTPVDHAFTHTRAIGWDTKSPVGYSSAGRYFGRKSFGHTGFTGTSIWFDPDQSLFVILLTNRVYPTRDNNRHVAVRPAVAEVAYRALKPVAIGYGGVRRNPFGGD